MNNSIKNKIAIIGSGISGLSVARILCKKYDVQLFEKNNYLGGHTHTHELNSSIGPQNVDSGFIVFNDRTYPNFIKLLKILKVESQNSEMGFSLKAENDFEYSGNSLSSLFAKKSHLFNLNFFLFLKNILRFNKISLSNQNIDSSTTLSDFLKKNNISDFTIKNYIIPMGAAIWSTSPSMMLEMPALFFIKFLKNHGLLTIFDRPQWKVIKGGSKSYVKRLIQPFLNQIHTNAKIKSVKRQKNYIELKGAEFSEKFDKVVIATHSDQALDLLENPKSNELDVLSKIKYQKNSATIHTDTSILPNRKKAWSSWNYLSSNNSKNVILTYNMNILQKLKSPETFCVTINDPGLVDESKIIKKINYEHPLFTNESVSAQKKIKEINSNSRILFCGAYCGYGFHEDGLKSALDVCKEFNLSLNDA
ncbi:FAD-dependent oxidoreductase [Candidatus Marinimicrobia bacterium]|nr:FAD-dependent oxidoreductase [Candidatus Neomarinimicrobiota bacterium]